MSKINSDVVGRKVETIAGGVVGTITKVETLDHGRTILYTVKPDSVFLKSAKFRWSDLKLL